MKNMNYLDEIKELATRIKESNEWDPDDCRDLCKYAGMLSAWDEADGDTFERVLFAAAEKLGVEII